MKISSYISVVLPTHNRVDLLKNSIKSVLNQSYNNFELIIVDDASEDNTENYVKSINDNRVKYIKNMNSKGGSESRNIGIENSNGEYIAFLDDDDEWTPKKLEKQLEKFNNNNNLGLVYTGVKIYFEQQDFFYNSYPNKSGFIYKDMLKKNHIGVTPSVMVKKKVLFDVGKFDVSLPARQDYDLWLRITKKYKIDFIKDPLTISFARVNLDRISSDVMNYEKANKIIENKYKQDIKSLFNKKELKERNAEKNFFMGSQAIKINNKELARTYFVESFKLNPSIKNFFAILMTFFGFKALIRARKIYGKIFR